jgi:multidrug efflux pump subunit AcrB
MFFNCTFSHAKISKNFSKNQASTPSSFTQSIYQQSCGFKSTLIVLSVVPLGVVGGLLLLFLTGNTLSFTSIVGFIALVGIEVKTSILLVDFTNQLREQGVSIDEAEQKAGEIRFVPVLLTTMTAIGGLLPIALSGSALYSPLAWVIIGGLISSTVLARLVTPVMYKLLPPEVKITR